jgi:catechol 2,3-dioxygenase-like lactoylglutathione lyase family enzyme
MAAMALSLSADHVAFPITEVAASRRFYGQVLGLPLVEAHAGDDWGGHPWLMMIFALADGRQLALCARHGAAPAPEDPAPRDLRHYALRCADAGELSRWADRLRAHEVTFWEEDHGAQRSIYFADPNGIVLEITTPAPLAAASTQADAQVQAWLAAHPSTG